MANRLIAIGDVHGCWSELESLLNHLQPQRDDRILFLGDLVNRGPDSRRVLRIARQYRADALLGNHEWRLLNYYRLGDPGILKDYDWDTVEELEKEDWDFFAHMRLYHYEEPYETLFVHGGFLPGIPWQQQTVSVVTRIQVVDEYGQPRKRSESPTSPHWSSLWKGPPFVVYGHTPRLKIQHTEWTLGLDTACAHGGHLSAYVLPEKRIYQVPARRTYVPKTVT